jgi:hypothetical protein
MDSTWSDVIAFEAKHLASSAIRFASALLRARFFGARELAQFSSAPRRRRLATAAFMLGNCLRNSGVKFIAV